MCGESKVSPDERLAQDGQGLSVLQTSKTVHIKPAAGVGTGGTITLRIPPRFCSVDVTGSGASPRKKLAQLVLPDRSITVRHENQMQAAALLAPSLFTACSPNSQIQDAARAQVAV